MRRMASRSWVGINSDYCRRILPSSIANIARQAGHREWRSLRPRHRSHSVAHLVDHRQRLRSDQLEWQHCPANYLKNLVRQLASPGAGYNPNTNDLPGVEFLSAVLNPTNTFYQDLAVAIPVPEPSTLAIATLGALGLMGYGWCRRARSRRVGRGSPDLSTAGSRGRKPHDPRPPGP